MLRRGRDLACRKEVELLAVALPPRPAGPSAETGHMPWPFGKQEPRT
jgi:hypothetical protein